MPVLPDRWQVLHQSCINVQDMTAASRPLYIRLAESIRRDIAAGRLIEGDRLAPERDMARAMGVAVGTLRKALKHLQDQGLLERRQGSGNYVSDTRAAGAFHGCFRLERIGGGGRPTAELLAVEVVTKPPGLPAIGPSSTAHRIRRLRRIGGVAAALEEIWLDARHAARLGPDLPGALYRHYATALGLRICAVSDAVGLAVAPGWAPPAFAPGPGARVGHIRRHATDQHGQLAEISDTWFDTDKVRYMNRIA